ncbi:solute carrier family 39 (zinc transporter), member 1/2/3 [Strigomonas culicis]|uniref:Solute carrier family 39 (Zinc transporter), member 1/2/3 n=1 Tax=Strigomonas culicis TaxID=28005 RepID=S9U7T2_9TRYP|nr:solute carrier family 39 (zinc transporter), member 1/2/3 [Strigomonas culicis]|eukprot:EPY26807.1 solute carrier family 39 (zinc transporter), member 1/2/3 [Strigomonas culicis]
MGQSVSETTSLCEGLAGRLQPRTARGRDHHRAELERVGHDAAHDHQIHPVPAAPAVHLRDREDGGHRRAALRVDGAPAAGRGRGLRRGLRAGELHGVVQRLRLHVLHRVGAADARDGLLPGGGDGALGGQEARRPRAEAEGGGAAQAGGEGGGAGRRRVRPGGPRGADGRRGGGGARRQPRADVPRPPELRPRARPDGAGRGRGEGRAARPQPRLRDAGRQEPAAPHHRGHLHGVRRDAALRVRGARARPQLGRGAQAAADRHRVPPAVRGHVAGQPAGGREVPRGAGHHPGPHLLHLRAARHGGRDHRRQRAAGRDVGPRLRHDARDPEQLLRGHSAVPGLQPALHRLHGRREALLRADDPPPAHALREGPDGQRQPAPQGEEGHPLRGAVDGHGPHGAGRQVAVSDYVCFVSSFICFPTSRINLFFFFF